MEALLCITPAKKPSAIELHRKLPAHHRQPIFGYGDEVTGIARIPR